METPKAFTLPSSFSLLNALATSSGLMNGSGGALKDGVIEIQGEQRDLLVSELTKRGFTVKKVGG